MTFLKPTEVDKAARRVESVQIIAGLLLPVFFFDGLFCRVAIDFRANFFSFFLLTVYTEWRTDFP